MAARRQKPPLSIIEFCLDKQLLNLTLSPAQTTLLKVIEGMALTKDERSIYTLCTGRTTYEQGHPFQEVSVIAGARSGKDSRIAAPLTLYDAIWGGYDRLLAKGEKGVIALVAQDKDATKVLFDYVKSYFLESPILRSMVASEPLAQEIPLTNGLRIVTFPCSQKSLRAWSIPLAVLDELAFYKFEGGVNTDGEIQASIRRGQISFGSRARLLKISTPYTKDGILWDDFQHAWAKPDPDLLVWKASTELMNPSIRTPVLDRERRRDPARFAREYLGEFATDVSAFLSGPLIEHALVPGRLGLPPVPGRFYVGAVDASGGGACAFTMNIVTVEPDSKPDIVECLSMGWERSRDRQLDLEGVVSDACSIFAAYGITAVMSDRYSAGWARQAFGRRGVTLFDAKDKSTTYGELEPLFTAGRVACLDHPVKNRQLGLLERRPRPGGKPLISPPRGTHDDYANSFALACVAAAENMDLPVIDTAPTQDELEMLRESFPMLELQNFRDLT